MPEIVQTAGSYAAAAATVGLLLVYVLVGSARRDLGRIEQWRELEPERGEPITEAQPVLGPRPEPEPQTAEQTTGSAAVERVTSERPALARITTGERAALEREPHWKRVLRRLPEPRHPMLIAAGAFLVGAGIFLGAAKLLEETPDPRKAPGAQTEEIASVTVLNGSRAAGLAGNVADDVRVNGFALESVSSSKRSYSQTVVMYTDAHKREGRQLAQALGIKPLQPIDRAASRASSGADLVVIAGDDRIG